MNISLLLLESYLSLRRLKIHTLLPFCARVYLQEFCFMGERGGCCYRHEKVPGGSNQNMGTIYTYCSYFSGVGTLGIVRLFDLYNPVTLRRETAARAETAVPRD